MNKLGKIFALRDIMILSFSILVVQSVSYFYSDFTPPNFYVQSINIHGWGLIFALLALLTASGVFIKNYLYVRFLYLGIATFSLLWGFGFILGLGLVPGDYRGLIGTALWTFVGYTNFREIDKPNPHLSDTFWAKTNNS